MSPMEEVMRFGKKGNLNPRGHLDGPSRNSRPVKGIVNHLPRTGWEEVTFIMNVKARGDLDDPSREKL
ncbi:hypothetical protein MTR67_011949, partial [Solanum verrucosum]